jgi:hypothetical protein
MNPKTFLKVFEGVIGGEPCEASSRSLATFTSSQKVPPIPKGKLTSVAILGGGTKMAAGAIVWNCKRNKKVCLTA